MFERYTETARRVIFFARFQASSFGSAEIDPIHLLLGLLREPGGSTPQPGTVSSVSSSHLPFSHKSKRVLAYSGEEAERLRHQYIDNVHLLLALTRDPTVSTLLPTRELLRDQLLTHGENESSRSSAVFASLPPDLLVLAEEMAAKGTQPVLTALNEHAVIEHNRSFNGMHISVTETIASGPAPGVLEYSVIVHAFGEQRSWRTTFGAQPPSA